MSVPQISVSLAPPEVTPAEPYSPFANTSFKVPQSDDAFRPTHLTPPPVHARGFRTKGSTYKSPDEPAKQIGKGLDRARFEALLNASKEKPTVTKKPADLRKEVAVKAHKNRQAERRALFLSKVLAPPSPTAATTPATPPDSPALFHYSLPSPGLVSPLAHYESLHEDDADGPLTLPCKPWVEQVDFKLLAAPIGRKRSAVASSKKGIPSLEQISARLNSYRAARAFNEGIDVPIIQSAPVKSTHREQLSHLVVGRLKMPVRSGPKRPEITVTDTTIAPVPVPELKLCEPPKSPLLTSPSELKITTLVVPRMQSNSPTELTRINLLALDSRETRTSAMLSTLRRRTQSSEFYGMPSKPVVVADLPKKALRRHSAPPESMAMRERKGFEHPVSGLPGAF
ncbi:hypothetical protein FA15DRAFT_580238 [Coprinopsis marcescibilis]|uniref:Uncharacterized protein n=1 Tax=Coprinopsis marcescibilis TaxID=230819 RepID=A0A5C3LC26_COPMA|nr:hypothetical protein FA15DRAFT_580238 [Coprinopsis marcescibilis]